MHVVVALPTPIAYQSLNPRQSLEESIDPVTCQLLGQSLAIADPGSDPLSLAMSSSSSLTRSPNGVNPNTLALLRQCEEAQARSRANSNLGVLADGADGNAATTGAGTRGRHGAIPPPTPANAERVQNNVAANENAREGPSARPAGTATPNNRKAVAMGVSSPDVRPGSTTTTTTTPADPDPPGFESIEETNTNAQAGSSATAGGDGGDGTANANSASRLVNPKPVNPAPAPAAAGPPGSGAPTLNPQANSLAATNSPAAADSNSAAVSTEPPATANSNIATGTPNANSAAPAGSSSTANGSSASSSSGTGATANSNAAGFSAAPSGGGRGATAAPGGLGFNAVGLNGLGGGLPGGSALPAAPAALPAAPAGVPNVPGAPPSQDVGEFVPSERQADSLESSTAGGATNVANTAAPCEDGDVTVCSDTTTGA
ncbi:hypothetical protein EIP91_007347 [Steccherinum ochraceum]|uniref:Uncharacterized protein n=1 Tax=Steccherinum ochraceum TaxID=92696 RepID=A0A4R0RRR3_9APHY|nr:hypothetical protein EIP91_007347 [Steccherinum ochraceum]